jgi:hypothetical protein
VRTAAQLLAGSIPGTDAYRERIERAARLFVTRGPRSQPERRLVLASAVASSKGRPNFEVFQALEGLKLGDVARRLDFKPDEFIEALPPGEDIILLALMTTAAADGNAALTARLARRLSGPRALVMLWTHRPDGLEMPEDDRPVLIEALLDLALGGAFPDAQTLHTYYRIIHGPLPVPLAARLLASESWRTHVARLAAPEADNKTPNVVKETALLIPDAQLGAFLAAISGLPPHLTLPARLFAEFCQSLADTTPVAPLKPPS